MKQKGTVLGETASAVLSVYLLNQDQESAFALLGLIFQARLKTPFKGPIPPSVRAIWEASIKPELERMESNREAHTESGKLGGRPRTAPAPETKPKPKPKPNRNQNALKTESRGEERREERKKTGNLDLDSFLQLDRGAQVEAVREYAREEGLPEDLSERFVLFNRSRGWRGVADIGDTLRLFALRDSEKPRSGSSSEPPAGEDLETVARILGLSSEATRSETVAKAREWARARKLKVGTVQQALEAVLNSEREGAR